MIYIYSIVAGAVFFYSKVLARSRGAGGSDHPITRIARSPDFFWVAAKDQFCDEGREDRSAAVRWDVSVSSKTSQPAPGLEFPGDEKTSRLSPVFRIANTNSDFAFLM